MCDQTGQPRGVFFRCLQAHERLLDPTLELIATHVYGEETCRLLKPAASGEQLENPGGAEQASALRNRAAPAP